LNLATARRYPAEGLKKGSVVSEQINRKFCE